MCSFHFASGILGYPPSKDQSLTKINKCAQLVKNVFAEFVSPFAFAILGHDFSGGVPHALL